MNQNTLEPFGIQKSGLHFQGQNLKNQQSRPLTSRPRIQILKNSIQLYSVLPNI